MACFSLSVEGASRSCFCPVAGAWGRAPSHSSCRLSLICDLFFPAALSPLIVVLTVVRGLGRAPLRGLGPRPRIFLPLLSSILGAGGWGSAPSPPEVYPVQFRQNVFLLRPDEVLREEAFRPSGLLRFLLRKVLSGAWRAVLGSLKTSRLISSLPVLTEARRT